MIGILGGTFDPVHFGHLRPALEVQQSLGLDGVRLIPCHLPPHRPQPVASPRQRLAMLTAAIENYPVFTVDEREFQRAGPSYTLDTLISIHKEQRGVELCLLIGMDALRGLPSWHRWRELLEYCHIVVMTRPGAVFPEQGELADFICLHRVMQAEQLTLHSSGRLLFHTVSQLEISGTRIRELLAAGKGAGFLAPECVLEIIRNEKLYVTGNCNE